MKSCLFSLFLLFGSMQFSSAQCSTPILEGFGSISAVAIYNTYITIGSVADGYVSDTYDTEYVTTLMKEQQSMIGIVQYSLQECIDDDSEARLSEDDKKYLEQLIVCLTYLQSEAEGLMAYATDGTDDSLDDYSENRDKAWELIAELLGIE